MYTFVTDESRPEKYYAYPQVEKPNIKTATREITKITNNI